MRFFPAYENYKDSGVEWLGRVPSHWEVRPIRKVAKLESGHTPSRSKPEYWEDCTVPWFTLADVWQIREEGRTHVYETREMASELGLANSSARLLPAGTVILSRTASVGFSAIMGVPMATTQDFANWICGPTLLAEFLLACLKGMKGEFRRLMMGSTHNTIYMPDIEALVIAIPPLDEQRAIAAFLDREIGKIDALVEAQERLIGLLKEKRQAVISHAVTKGLAPSAPMKDSGVEWLGQVPAHWEVRPLKHLVSLRSGGTPSKGREDYWTGNIPWASAKDLKADRLSDTQDHLSKTAIDDGAATLAPIGSILVLVRGMMLARMFPISQTLVPMAINQDLKALTGKSGVNNSFLAWLLRGTERETLNRLDEAGHGTKALRMEAWLSMSLPIPPQDEQEQIVKALERELACVDALSDRASNAITLLQERRAALISAAVTGKIDVRGLVQTAEAA